MNWQEKEKIETLEIRIITGSICNLETMAISTIVFKVFTWKDYFHSSGQYQSSVGLGNQRFNQLHSYTRPIKREIYRRKMKPVAVFNTNLTLFFYLFH